MAEETIISDLEQAQLLTDDMVIAVEDTKNTYSTTLAQLRELVNKLFIEKENIDFNNLTDDGFYQVGGTLTNAPVAGSITWIVQVVKVGTVIVQNALPTDATNYARQFVRRNNGNSWGTWDVVGGKIIQSLTSSTTDVPCSKAVNDGLAKKQATITGGASTIVSNNLTASRALVSDSSGKVAVSAVTSTELGYLDGVTSNVQTQLNGKQESGSYMKLSGNQTASGNKTFSGQIIRSTAPSESDNSTQVPNTSWVNSRITSVMNNYPHIVKTYNSGANYWRLWSDGWLEQGGYLVVNNDGDNTFTLPKAYRDTNYNVLIGILSQHNQDAGYKYIGIRSQTKTNFTYWANSGYMTKKFWKTEGYQ